MPKKRVLDERFWDDEDVALLSRDERLLLAAMITNCADDFGRLMAGPAYLKKAAFGYDNDLPVEAVQAMRDHIVAVCRNVTLYEVEGRQYLELKKFAKYQDIRYRSRTTIPSPDGDLPTRYGKVTKQERETGKVPDETLENEGTSEKFPEVPEKSENVLQGRVGLSRVVLTTTRGEAENGGLAQVTTTYERLFATAINPTLADDFRDLSAHYPASEIVQAMQIAQKRGKSMVNGNYLRCILDDPKTRPRMREASRDNIVLLGRNPSPGVI